MKICLQCVLPFLVICSTTIGQTPGKALKKMLGKDFNNFEMYSTPSTNFGIGTACRSKWEPLGGMLCDMIKCYGLVGVPSNSEKWKNVNGFAYYGDTPPINFEDTALKVIGVGMLIPKLLNVLNINIGYDYSGTKSIHLKIDSAVIRTLDFDKFKEFAEALPKTTQMSKAYWDKKLVMVTADFVALKYSMELYPSDTIGVTLMARLDSLLKISPNFSLTKGDSLGLHFKRSAHRSYEISSSRPMVLGVVVRKQKRVLATMTDDSFSKWQVLDENEFIDPTEAKQAKKQFPK